MSNEGKVGRRPQVTDEELLEVLESGQDPVVTTADVAEQLPIGKRGVLKRLKKLEERGAIASKSVGARGQVWWVPTSGGEPAPIDRDDPFWDVEPGASGEDDVSERVDEILYGKEA